MWLLKRIKKGITYQTIFETLQQALDHIRKTQDSESYVITYLERNL
jgi:hypothetical protein